MHKYIFFFLLIFYLISCKSVKKISEHREVPTITEGKLYKNIAENEIKYTTLYAKKLNLSIIQEKKKSNLNGVIKIQKDNFIWISLNAPLGIEVSRILLTPDSVKFTDSYNKKYLLTDYTYFQEKYGVKFTYDCLQNIFMNIFFHPESCVEDNLKNVKFKFEKSLDSYVLSNIQKQSINRKVKKFFKKKRKNKDNSLILQQIKIHPKLFRPSNILIKDLDEDVEFSVNYENFKSYEGIVFPETLFLNFNAEENKFSVKLTFSRLEFNTKVTPNFRVSSKYEEIK